MIGDLYKAHIIISLGIGGKGNFRVDDRLLSKLSNLKLVGMALEIKGMNETSLLDWDGKVVATLFVPKCNFRCPFCHNHELIEHPDKFETIPFDQIKKFIFKNKYFLDGVCITGGEPLVYPDLREFIIKLRELDMMIKLDTNGSCPEIIVELINENIIDYIAMDIKAPLDEKIYETSSGAKVDIDKIKRSIDIIMNSGIDYEFRSTVVPTLLDIDGVVNICKSIKGAKKYVLQQFVPENTLEVELRNVKPYPNDQIKEMVSKCKEYVNKVTVRGLK